MGHFLRYLVVGQLAISASPAVADPLSYENQTHLTPGDYILRSHQDRQDSVFDGAKPIDLGVDLGVGADCGRVNFQSTLKSTLKNMLDSRYFGDLGRDIIAGSPMLLACYYSPTWCAILKHSQLSANFLSQMRLSQCQIIDKYVDSRTEDFYRERQSCAQQYIKQNGGDLETAMDACQNVFQSDLTSWAGGQNGKVSTNELIESSAKWAGFEGDDARRSVDLLKSMIGDTVISQGKVSVNFGPKGKASTPATHLRGLQGRFQKVLCDGVAGESGGASAEPADPEMGSVVKELNGSGGHPLIDRQTMESLAYMPRREREIACRRLADAAGLTVFTKDINRSLDILTTAAQNPNLPPNRRVEIDEKRRALKESVDLAVTLSKERDGVIDQVEAQINEAGERQKAIRGAGAVSADMNQERRNAATFNLMDCADAIWCQSNHSY